jgi:hypothetical protein
MSRLREEQEEPREHRRAACGPRSGANWAMSRLREEQEEPSYLREERLSK